MKGPSGRTWEVGQTELEGKPCSKLPHASSWPFCTSTARASHLLSAQSPSRKGPGLTNICIWHWREGWSGELLRGLWSAWGSEWPALLALRHSEGYKVSPMPCTPGFPGHSPQVPAHQQESRSTTEPHRGTLNNEKEQTMDACGILDERHWQNVEQKRLDGSAQAVQVNIQEVA